MRCLLLWLWSMVMNYMVAWWDVLHVPNPLVFSPTKPRAARSGGDELPSRLAEALERWGLARGGAKQSEAERSWAKLGEEDQPYLLVCRMIMDYS